MTTRWLRKSVPLPTISGSASCMTIHAGLDNTILQPPFMPVQRNEDGVFGMLRMIGFPHLLSGYLPGRIPHLPLVDRPAYAFDVLHQPPASRMNDLIVQYILQQQFLSAAPLELHEIGEMMIEASKTSDLVFENLLKQISKETQTRILNHALHFLNANPGLPAFWRKEIDAFIASRTLWLRDLPVLAPIDLPGSHEEKLRLLKNLFSLFGELLVHWPAMWEAARINSRARYDFKEPGV